MSITITERCIGDRCCLTAREGSLTLAIAEIGHDYDDLTWIRRGDSREARNAIRAYARHMFAEDDPESYSLSEPAGAMRWVQETA